MPKQTNNQLDISDLITPQGFKKLKLKQILTFNKDGVNKDYIITKLKPTRGICLVEPITLTEKMDGDQATDIISEKMLETQKRAKRIAKIAGKK